jgi:hypothetical protein
MGRSLVILLLKNAHTNYQNSIKPIQMKATAGGRAVLRIVSNKNVILALILSMALFLRLVHIRQSYTDNFGWRECSVAMMAQNYYEKGTSIFYPEINWGGPGETYNGREFQTVSYLAAIGYKYFGQHEWVGRLIPIFFSVWGLFAFFQLVKLVWDQPTAFVSTLFFAIIPYAIVVDRSFLPDPVMVSLSITALWLFVRFAHNPSLGKWIALLLVSCLAFLTKIPGMLVGLPMLYVMILYFRKNEKKTLRSLLPFFTFGLIVISVVASYYLWALYLSKNYPPYHFAGEFGWIWRGNLDTWLSNNYFLNDLHFQVTYFLWGEIFIALSLVGFFVSLMESKIPEKGNQFKPVYLFHFWAIGGVVFYLIGAEELKNNPSNFCIITPVIVAFAGRTLIAVNRTLMDKPGWKWAAIIAISLIIIERIVITPDIYQSLFKSDFEMGTKLSQLKKSKKDLVITLSEYPGSTVAIYYSGYKGWTFPPYGMDVDQSELPATDKEAISLFNNLKAQGATLFGIENSQYMKIKVNLPGFDKLLREYPKIDNKMSVIFQLQ